MTPQAERGPHPISWLVGSVLLGWLLVYNLMRFGGATPSDASWSSLIIGGTGGALVFGAFLFGARRLAASGRVVRPPAGEVPAPSALTEGQRTLTRIVWPLLAVWATVALTMGLLLGADWYTRAAENRAITLLVLAAWNLLIALWIGDEAIRLVRFEAEGIESVALGAAITVVLAAVGFTRGYLPFGQVTLLIVAGIAGTAAALMMWRLRRAGPIPLAGPLVALVTLASLVVASS